MKIATRNWDYLIRISLKEEEIFIATDHAVKIYENLLCIGDDIYDLEREKIVLTINDITHLISPNLAYHEGYVYDFTLEKQHIPFPLTKSESEEVRRLENIFLNLIFSCLEVFTMFQKHCKIINNGFGMKQMGRSSLTISIHYFG